MTARARAVVAGPESELLADTTQMDADRRTWLDQKLKEEGIVIRDPKRKCSKCGGGLRMVNGKVQDPCFSCRNGKAPKAASAMPGLSVGAPVTAPASRGRKPSGDVRKRFKVVAEAMGDDPDELLAAYCESYIEDLKDAARKRAEAREADSFKTPMERAS